MNDVSEDLPEPGSPEAVAQGCLCDMIDEEPADNARWPMFKVRRCPIHGPAAQGQ